MSMCPVCNSWHSKVRESRKDTRFGWKWRLRDCQQCEHRWTTYEIPTDSLKRFAGLVAAAERQACAQMVEPVDESLADAIRARGKR